MNDISVDGPWRSEMTLCIHNEVSSRSSELASIPSLSLPSPKLQWALAIVLIPYLLLSKGVLWVPYAWAGLHFPNSHFYHLLPRDVSDVISCTRPSAVLTLKEWLRELKAARTLAKLTPIDIVQKLYALHFRWVKILTEVTIRFSRYAGLKIHLR